VGEWGNGRETSFPHSPILPLSHSPTLPPTMHLRISASLLLAAALPAWGGEQVGEWKPAGALSTGRYAPGAALLADGRVLLAGGFSFETGRTHATSDVFDPAKEGGKWTEGPRMRSDRNFPVVLPLPGGDALFVAGFRIPGGTTATTERLDTQQVRFQAGEPAQEERELFSVTALKDGRFLIAGGYSTLRRKTLNTAEIYDPKTGRFAPTAGKLSHIRFGHDGVLLPDGRVLIVGGKVLANNLDVLPAEIFDPQTGMFAETGSLRVGRDRCTAWLLPDNKRVLVAGGSARQGGTAPARACEVYDIAAGRFAPGPELVRDRMAHTMTPLGDGRVLLAGGWCTSENATTRQAELWDPKAERFLPAGMLAHGRHDHAAVLLKDGRVLVAGGKEAPARDGVETPLAAEVWTVKR
jgi:hypothetical protein